MKFGVFQSEAATRDTSKSIMAIYKVEYLTKPEGLHRDVLAHFEQLCNSGKPRMNDTLKSNRYILRLHRVVDVNNKGYKVACMVTATATAKGRGENPRSHIIHAIVRPIHF